MQRRIICDTSVLIIFERINEFSILQKVFGSIYITDVIAEEFGKSLPSWITVERPRDSNKIREFERMVDKGEASAITLALELPGSFIIVDDIDARAIVRKLNIPFTGSAGVLLIAKQQHIIPQVRSYLNKMVSSGFHINQDIIKEITRQADE